MSNISKKIIAGITVFSIAAAYSCSMVHAAEQSSYTPGVFNKSGYLVTLVKDYDSYFIKRENYSPAGSVLGTSVIQTISEAEYDDALHSGEYDLLHTVSVGTSVNGTIISKNDSRLYTINIFKRPDGRYVEPSMIGSIPASFDSYSTFASMIDKLDGTYSCLYSYNNQHFRVSVNKADGLAVVTPVSSEKFTELKNNMAKNKLAFYRSVLIGNGVFSDIVYDAENKESIILAKDSSDIGIEVAAVADGHQYNDTSSLVNDPVNSGFNSDIYGEKYTEWSDENNQGYIGMWSDPSYVGDKEIIEWADPFWKNEHQSGENAVAGGYYDDYGNFIKTDKYGNVVPGVPGSFDSDGNFQPEDVLGYYDASGVFHFESRPIIGGTVTEDGKFKIENTEYSGYFDANGGWHSSGDNGKFIYYGDGNKISRNGTVYSPAGEVLGKANSDMLGTFYFKDKVYYSDSVIFDKTKKILININGEEIPINKSQNGFYYFADGTGIRGNGNVKGNTIGDIGIKLASGTVIYEDGTIKYSSGETYSGGYIIKDGKKNKVAVKNDRMLVENKIFFLNGTTAEPDALGNMVTDTDAVLLSNGRYLLSNGYLLDNRGVIIASYLDGNQNVVTVNGLVFNRRLEEGVYDSTGTFIKGGQISGGYFDRLGNKIVEVSGAINGKVNKYYTESGDLSDIRPEGGFFTCDGIFISDISGEAEAGPSFGFYDIYNNFVLNNNTGVFDSDGVFFPTYKADTLYVSESGLLSTRHSTGYRVNQSGELYLPGYTAVYVGDGLFKSNGSTGKYTSSGIFIVTANNDDFKAGGFYGPDGAWNDKNDFYVNANGDIRTLYAPALGLKAVDDKHIGFTYSDSVFSVDGITNVDGQTGYYTSEGFFVQSGTYLVSVGAALSNPPVSHSLLTLALN